MGWGRTGELFEKTGKRAVEEAVEVLEADFEAGDACPPMDPGRELDTDEVAPQEWAQSLG